MNNFMNSIKQFVNQNQMLTGFFLGWAFVYTGLHSIVYDFGNDAYHEIAGEVAPERTVLEIINPFDGR